MRSLLALLLLSIPTIDSVAAEPVFRAGAYVADITPKTFPVPSNGSMGPRFAEGAHDPLSARCLVLDDGETKIAFAVVDSCMIHRATFDAAKEKAAKATGIPTDHMLFSATHTHSAVSVAGVFQSEPDAEYEKWLIDRIAEGVKEAHERLEPAEIGWAVGRNASQVFNRRWRMRPGFEYADPFGNGTDRVRMNPPRGDSKLLEPAGPIDPQVPLLAFRSPEGRPIAVLANYSLHYVGGVPSRMLSADYFAEFARQFTRLIEAEKTGDDQSPFVGIMTNGTSGDINNIDFYQPGTSRQPFEQIRLVATDVAESAATAYRRTEFQKWVPLAMAETEVELGVRKPDRKEWERATRLLEEAGDGPYRDRELIYARETVFLGEYPQTVKAKLQAIRIGDLGIASSPCETFVETGLAIKKASPLKPTFVIELANGYNGYLPTPEQHELGGYETWRARSSYLAVDAEPKIRKTLLELLEEVANPPGVAGVRQRRPPDVARAVGVPPVRPQPPSETAQDTLESVDRVRGGRHWVDQPTDPPRSPEESRKAFEVEEGLEIELFAAEPLVRDPVAIAFDEKGRAFVVEYGDYPTGPVDKDAKPLSRVVILDDIDGDHRADKRTVFADHLDFAHSLLPYDGGIIVGAKTQLLFLKDTDGDDRADVRDVLYEGFTPAHPQMQIGNPRYGLDNRVYCNYGPGTITSPKRSGETVEMPRGEFVFDPRTWEFGPAAGLGQFGNTIDNWGRRFFCTNRNPIMTPAIPYDVARRNKYAPLSKLHYDVAPAGGDTRVHPLVAMKSNYLSHAGTHTSACGVTAYRGDLLGPGYVDNVFVCEPIGHLVTRSRIVEEGVELRAERIGDGRDFLASRDTWFRPASLTDGPDGALYLADMYRLWVEHPKFLPEDVAAKIDWRAGEDRGRIWRITPKGAEPRRFQPPKTTGDRVTLLSDPNGWRRELGQRLIVEGGEKEAVEPLHAMTELRGSALSEAQVALTTPGLRVRTLWTLDGLGALTSNDLPTFLRHPDARVRREAVRLAARHGSDFPEFRRWLDGQARTETHPAVRFAFLLALGAASDLESSEAIATIAQRDGTNRWVRDAVLTATETRSGAVLGHLVEDEEWAASGDAARIDLVRRLAAVVGARGDLDELRGVLELLDDETATGGWWRTAILTGLAEGLPRHRGAMGRTSLAKLAAEPPQGLADSVDAARRGLRDAKDVALDSEKPVGDRLAAIGLLATQPFDDIADSAVTLMKPSQPKAVRAATLEAIRGGGVGAARIVLKAWPTLGPQLRGTALSMLLGRTDTTKLALGAMADGRVEPSAVDLDLRVRLLRHGDADVRELATKLFGGAVSADRREVAKKYEPALETAGDVERGRAVFAKTCAKCHRLSGVGHEVGPDISDVSNRPRDALLFDILDPNRKVEPRFAEYSVVTTDGRLFNGLLAAENEASIVLRRPEGKEDVVDRADVEILKATGRSLMPEGVEKEIDVEAMADLLAFLTERR